MTLVFILHAPLTDKDKRLKEASCWERLTVGKLGLVLMGGDMLSKSSIQFSVDGLGCVPYLKFSLRPTYGRGNGSNGDCLQKDLLQHATASRTVVVSASHPTAGHC